MAWRVMADDSGAVAAAAGRTASASQRWSHHVVATAAGLLPRAVDSFLDEEPEGLCAELDRVWRDLGLVGGVGWGV